MALDPTLLDEAESRHRRVLDAEHHLERARADFHDALRRLYAAGGSLRELASRFGLSHQRVHQIVDVDVAGAAGGKGKGTVLLDRIKGRVRDWGGFTRFTHDAREVVRRAELEAADLGHERIGTEHLLLGLLRGGEADVAARALAGLGVGLEPVRAEVVRQLGQGGGRRRATFTPRAKKVLELALREAVRRSDDHIGTEHILLGLVREPAGLAARILRELGADPDAVRAAVDRHV